jgi:alpha-glucosidase
MPGHRWWQGAILYQIYVRSWLDADDDGYGDLRGIISRLDYLEWLGVDGIWLSPTMPSPDQDWGYDVSDYLSVHPELGSIDDLDSLVAEAGKRGMRVLLDLVPNHTSSAHPWFVDASAARDSPHRDYYVWADPGPGGGPPNNWIDATGHPAWEWHAESGQYYLHNFLPSQPDLNWWLPAVQHEFKEILKFWFDRGIAGLRIDVAHGLYKDALLRDNPPLAHADPLQGRFGQRPVYSANRPQTHGVFRDWRALADSYSPPRLLLGETWVGDLRALASYYGDDDELDLAFNFVFVFAEFAASALAGVVAQTLAKLPIGACPVWMASNHDVGRFATRWCNGDERKIKLALLVLATLPGTTVLYYGDEIGMTDVPVPADLQRDTMRLGGVAAGSSRDRARTPMQWDSSPSAGFTTGSTRPWLPAGEISGRSVEAQRDDPDSILRFCRDLITLRKTELGPAIVQYAQVRAVPDGVWSYVAGPLVIAVNLTDRPVTIPGFRGTDMLLRTMGAGGLTNQVVSLAPWEGLVMRSDGQVNDQIPAQVAAS